MGREIKRVPAYFEWRMERVWKGFVDPYWPRHEACSACGRFNSYTRKMEKGDGLSDAARGISERFYDSSWGGAYPSPRRWCDKITQDEVERLVEEERLWDFTTRIVNLDEPDENGRTWKRERILNEDGTPFIPTAEQVNKWERERGVGHDAINRWILIRHRWKKAGLVEDEQIYCQVCKGEGVLWPDPQDKVRHENFHAENPDPSIGEVSSGPPTGPWWQVWETVSEGSPVTPAFATADELIDYLVRYGDIACQKCPDERPPTREAATRFVKGSGWLPSGSSGFGGVGFVSGIQQAEYIFNEDSEEE